VVRVHSFDAFAAVGWFDPATGALETYARPAGEPGPEGHFAELGGHVLVFYRADGGELRLAAAGRSLRADASTVRWSEANGEHTLSVNEPGQPPLELRYRGDAFDEDDPTPFAEPEDWDFGRFVAGVVDDPDRAAQIYRREPAR
jgi:hypothetical protein